MATTQLYGQDRTAAWETWSSCLSGNRNGLICVLAHDRPQEGTVIALQKSFAALGYGEQACTFVDTRAFITQCEEAANMENAEAVLSGKFFTLMESLDPILVVIADRESAALCEKTYKQAVALNGNLNLFGRHACAFSNLNSWVADEARKQQVWAILKSL